MAKKKSHKKSAAKASKSTSKPARRTAGKPAAKAPRSRRKVSPRRADAHRRLRAAPAPVVSKERAITTLRFAHTMLLDLLKGIPTDKALFQPAPTENHVMWTLGHLASSYQWFASALGGPTLEKPEGFDTAFAYGCKPLPDAAAYPDLAEVRRFFDATFDAFLTCALALPDAMVTAPCAIETSGFARDRLDMIEKAAWHEGWHSGQISDIRRALGIKPLMG